MKDKKFYVYELRDSYGNILYVGKGSNGRMHEHVNIAINDRDTVNKRFYNKIRKIYREGYSVCSVKVFESNLESECFHKEKELISKYGRKDLNTGLLYNLTDGGEGISGAIVSIETRKKLSYQKLGEKNPMFGRGFLISGEKNQWFGVKGEDNPNYGRKASPETIENLKASHPSENFTGHRNPFFGKTHSEESKRKMSQASKGRKLSQSQRDAISARMKGEGHWNFGKKASEETREKLIVSHLGYCPTEEHRKHLSDAGKGRVFSLETRKKISESRIAANKRLREESLR